MGVWRPAIVTAIVRAIVAVSVFVALASGAVRAADFYADKKLIVVVGSATGGGYDQYARVFARHIAKHIPGNPSTIVQNMPGAGSVTAARYLDGNAPKDGTVVLSFNSALITASLTAPETVNMKFTDVAWIGAMTHEFRVCYAWHETGLKSWDDLRNTKKTYVVGVTGSGTAGYINGALLQNLFGINIRQVLGYTGSAQQKLAIERGELDGSCTEWNTLPQNWIDGKKIYPLVRWLKETPEGFDYPGAAYAGDKAPNAEAKEILELLGAPGELGNPFVASKQVPADRIAILRAAFDKMIVDPELKDELQKMHQPLEPTSWQRAQDLVGSIYASATPELVAKAKAAMQ
jgi:tripartite-type tricarboxylate transporter receptor subunit TctC